MIPPTRTPDACPYLPYLPVVLEELREGQSELEESVSAAHHDAIRANKKIDGLSPHLEALKELNDWVNSRDGSDMIMVELNVDVLKEKLETLQAMFIDLKVDVERLAMDYDLADETTSTLVRCDMHDQAGEADQSICSECVHRQLQQYRGEVNNRLHQQALVCDKAQLQFRDVQDVVVELRESRDRAHEQIATLEGEVKSLQDQCEKQGARMDAVEKLLQAPTDITIKTSGGEEGEERIEVARKPVQIQMTIN
jgi:hypothetical protein